MYVRLSFPPRAQFNLGDVAGYSGWVTEKSRVPHYYTTTETIFAPPVFIIMYCTNYTGFPLKTCARDRFSVGIQSRRCRSRRDYVVLHILHYK